MPLKYLFNAAKNAGIKAALSQHAQKYLVASQLISNAKDANPAVQFDPQTSLEDKIASYTQAKLEDLEDPEAVTEAINDQQEKNHERWREEANSTEATKSNYEYGSKPGSAPSEEAWQALASEQDMIIEYQYQMEVQEAQEEYEQAVRESEQAYSAAVEEAEKAYNEAVKEAEQKYNQAEREAEMEYSKAAREVGEEQAKSQRDAALEQAAAQRDADLEQAATEKDAALTQAEADRQSVQENAAARRDAAVEKAEEKRQTAQTVWSSDSSQTENEKTWDDGITL